MPSSFRTLERAMGVSGPATPAPTWGEVMGDLWPVISSPLSLEGERLLLDVIRYTGSLRLTETTDLPHSLPPEEMLKSLAVQALARWTRLTYLREMQRLELTARSPALQSVVKAAIQSARTVRPQEPGADAISEEEAIPEADEDATWSVFPLPRLRPRPRPRPEPSRRLVARPLARLGSLTYISGERPVKGHRREEFEFAGHPE